MISWLTSLCVATSAVITLVLFLPPASQVFHNHPECSIAGFSPDFTQKQKAFCRKWSSRGQK